MSTIKPVVSVLMIMNSATMTHGVSRMLYSHWNARELLSAPQSPHNTQPNFTMTRSTTVLPENTSWNTTIFDVKVDVVQSAPIFSFLSNHLYAIIAVILAVTQIAVVYCLIVHCRKQSVINKQIEELSSKINKLISISQQPPSPQIQQHSSFNTLTGVTVSSALRPLPIPQSTNQVTINAMANQLHLPLPSHSPGSPDSAHAQPSYRSVAEKQTPFSIDCENMSSNDDVDQLRPWSPKTDNHTLPISRGSSNRSCFVNMNSNPLSTSVKLANAMHDMNNMNRMRLKQKDDDSSDENNLDADGNTLTVPTHRADNDSVWSETRNISTLVKGQSGFSMASNDSANADSVLGEMLGLKTCHDSKQMEDMDVVIRPNENMSLTHNTVNVSKSYAL